MLRTAVDLNQPGHYLHWWIFTISLANLLVIAVMLVIFVAALVVPFPAGRKVANPEATVTADGGPDGSAGGDPPAPGAGAGEGERSWTGSARRYLVRRLPPGKLLPDTQPSYVASWIYVFGVACLAALGVAIVSGFLIALGGVDWWHTNPVGHFFNSLHLWSVELFFAFMVIHLWGKFFMAAWRGGRARTWITGVLAFAASVGEAFTGYLSQSNFDSQWIATNGKDAFNAAGIGGFFNLLNSGQMLLWHVVLLPALLIAVVGLHVLLVRYRGVVHPYPARKGRDAVGAPLPTAGTAEVPRAAKLSHREAEAADRREWRGPLRTYDLLREAVAATAIVVAVTVALAGVLSSPDVNAITLRKWAQADAADFVGTTATELAGTSLSAAYGPPYNNGSGSVQGIGPSWQNAAGVRIPIDPAQSFVIIPLTATSARDQVLSAALARWAAASPDQRTKWASAYADAAAKVTFTQAGTPVVRPGDYGPVPQLVASELRLARDGGLDADLVAQQPFYGSNYTKPLLFLADGGYYSDQAAAEHLPGDQWGVMNETGSYPGQPWLWLYQLWYHVPGFDHSANVDLIAIYLTGAATILLLLIPFIPGLRDIPRLIPLHRLIWRSYYRDAESGGDGAPGPGPVEPAGPARQEAPAGSTPG